MLLIDPVLNLLFRALISMLPSLISSFMNLLVRSSSISWHFSRSLKSGLSKKESLNSRAGNPIVLNCSREGKRIKKDETLLFCLVESHFFFFSRQFPFFFLSPLTIYSYLSNSWNAVSRKLTSGMLFPHSITRRRYFLSPTRIPTNPASCDYDWLTALWRPLFDWLAAYTSKRSDGVSMKR